MRTIKLEPISRQAFSEFGVYYSFQEPSGFALKGEHHLFYPDRLQAWAKEELGFSAICVKRPDRYWIKEVEYHTRTWEMIMPLNDDMIIHVAPPSGPEVISELTRAFLVPKGTLVKINTAVWHLAPLPAHKEELNAVIILPVCTYRNDCTVVSLSEEEQFEITKQQE